MNCLKHIKYFVFLFIFIFGFHSSFCQLKKNELKQKLANITVFWFDTKDGSHLDSNKYEYIYDTKGKVSSKLRYSWDEARNDWSIPYKEEYQRDASGNTILHTAFGFSNSYSYDQNGNLTEEINSTWNTSNKTWTNVSKKENTYNGKKQIINQTTAEWNVINKKWVIFKITENAYDSNGNHILSLQLLRDTTLNKLDSLQKHEMKYDKSNKIINERFLQWNKLSNQGILISNGKYTYNPLGELIKYKSGWGNSGNSLMDSTGLSYVYDLEGNLIVFEQQFWDTLNKNWVNLFKSEFYYDMSVESARLILPADLRLYGYPTYKNRMTEKVEYDWNLKSSSWDKRIVTKFNYSNFVSMDKNDNGVVVFPNPTSGNIFVEVQKHPGKITLKIFDLTGKLIMTNNSYNSNSINMESLTKGLYLLGVYEDNRLISKAKILLKE